MKDPGNLEEMVDYAIYRLALVANQLKRSGFPLTAEQDGRLKDLAEEIYIRAGRMAETAGRSDLM